jgi:hypothetical protein
MTDNTSTDIGPHETVEKDRAGVRAEVLIAIAIAAVSLTTAIAAWRTSVLGSNAGGAERQGLIESLQVQSLANEDWRMVFEEAANAQRFFATEAEVEALEASGDAASQEQAEALRQYLLPNLALVAGPLTTQDTYLNPDGSLDLEQRFADLQSANLALAELDPQATFAEADRLHAEHRWLVVGTVLLAVSLFWLALAEINQNRSRRMALSLGLVVFVFGLAWFAIVELVSYLSRAGGA